MTRKIVIIAVFLCAVTSVNAQKQLDTSYMECSYRLTVMIDTVAKRTRVADPDMRLLIGEKYSKYYSHTIFLSDSARAATPSTGQVISLPNFGTLSVEIYEIYKNHIENTITTTELILVATGSYVLCNEPLQKQDWKILDETKEIAGYKCQKATCSFRGRDYVAWFTREVPVNTAPHKFSGLPGLVVKIHDTKRHYDFELYSVEKVKKPIIFSPFQKLKNIKYHEVSIKDYIRMLRNYHANPFAMATDMVATNADGTPFTLKSLFDAMELEP